MILILILEAHGIQSTYDNIADEQRTENREPISIKEQ